MAGIAGARFVDERIAPAYLATWLADELAAECAGYADQTGSE